MYKKIVLLIVFSLNAFSCHAMDIVEELSRVIADAPANAFVEAFSRGFADAIEAKENREGRENGTKWLASIGCAYKDPFEIGGPLTKEISLNNFWKAADIFTPEAKEALVDVGCEKIKGKSNHILLRRFLAGALYSGATGNQKEEWGCSNIILKKAIDNKDSYLAQLAVKYGANPNASYDPNIFLVMQANEQIGKILIGAGASLCVKDATGFPLLHYATVTEPATYLSYVLEVARIRGQSIIQDKDHRDLNALQILLHRSHKYKSYDELLKKTDLLIAAGIPLLYRNRDGDSAQDIAFTAATNKINLETTRKMSVRIFQHLCQLRSNLMEKMAADQKSCVICLEDMNHADCKQLWCGHMFHFSCIIPAFTEKPACPLCRMVIKASDLQ